MKSFLKNIFTAAIISASGIFLLTGCEKSNANTFNQNQQIIKPVKGFEVQAHESLQAHSFPAVITPEKEINLSFRVGGPIVEMSLETGQKVTKGEILAKIDKRDFILKIKNLNATLEASKAELKDALLQYERYKSLVKENAAAKSKFDQVEAAYKSIKARTNALEKQLENAQNAYSDTNLYAPVSGYVNELYSENHETVSMGQPVLSVVKTDKIEIKAFIPESLVTQAKDFDNFTFSLNSAPGKSFNASLKEIGEKATGAGNTYPIILTAETIDDIKPGMSAIINFTSKVDENKNFFTIPLSAVVSNDYDLPVIWKIDTEKHLPIKTTIKLHKLADNEYAIISGNIKKGDFIVSAGANYIKATTKIKLIPPFSETNYGNEL